MDSDTNIKANEFRLTHCFSDATCLWFSVLSQLCTTACSIVCVFNDEEKKLPSLPLKSEWQEKNMMLPLFNSFKAHRCWWAKLLNCSESNLQTTSICMEFNRRVWCLSNLRLFVFTDLISHNNTPSLVSPNSCTTTAQHIHSAII